MKKIVKGIVLSLVAIIVICGSIAAYFLFGQKPEINDMPYIVDNEGSSYLAVVDKEGVTYAAVTDTVGNIYAAEVKEGGNIGETVGLINDQVSKEDLPTNYTGEKIDEIVDVNDFTGEADPVEVVDVGDNDDTTGVTRPSKEDNGNNTNTDTPNNNTNTTKPTGNGNTGNSEKPTQKPSQNSDEPSKQPSTAKPNRPANTGSNELRAYRVEKYQKIFESGQYLIEFKTNDPDLGDVPITVATKNGNVLITTSIENFKCKMLYLSSDKTTYLLIDDFKKYTKLPEDLMNDADMDIGQLMSGLAGEETSSKNIKVSKVKIGGKDLICESSKSAGGGETKSYFDGETLVRMDNVSADGTVDSTYISRFTSDVPDSTFQIPKGYGYLNLSWLEGLEGLGGKK